MHHEVNNDLWWFFPKLKHWYMFHNPFCFWTSQMCNSHLDCMCSLMWELIMIVVFKNSLHKHHYHNFSKILLHKINSKIQCQSCKYYVAKRVNSAFWMIKYHHLRISKKFSKLDFCELLNVAILILHNCCYFIST